MSDYGHAGNAPFCSSVSTIAERVGTRKTNPRSIAKKYRERNTAYGKTGGSTRTQRCGAAGKP